MGATLPNKFTCKGENISPPLQWTQPPALTKSIAVLCDDPDAPGGDWVHWVLFNLPADATSLDEGQPPSPRLPTGAVQGLNDFGTPGYKGPCPPPGKPHSYVFHVYALDTMLKLGSNATKPDLVRAMDGHILASGTLAGTFRR